LRRSTNNHYHRTSGGQGEADSCSLALHMLAILSASPNIGFRSNRRDPVQVRATPARTPVTESLFCLTEENPKTALNIIRTSWFGLLVSALTGATPPADKRCQNNKT